MKQYNNFWWPDVDVHCQQAVFSELHKLSLIYQYVQGSQVCVQAGGNVGVFPRELIKRFEVVYTFEPDPENFNCLVKNCPEPNIVKFMAGLGDHHEMIQVGAPDKAHEHNCGAYQILGEGIIPTLMIDDLDLPACDLIYLDIEGYEKFAVEGALETIACFEPVIVLEQKKLPIMYDLEPESATEYLVMNHGYEVMERPMRDIVLVHRSKI